MTGPTAPRPPLAITIVEPRGHGGMIHYAYQLAGGFAERGCDVTLLTSRDYELAGLEHPFRLDTSLRLWRGPEPRRAGGSAGRLATARRRIRRTLRRGSRAAVYVREWIRVVRHLERTRPDVVVFGMTPYPFEAIFLRRLRRSGLRLAQVCHEFHHDRHVPRRSARLRRAVRRPLDRPLLMSFDALFVHGGRIRDELREAFRLPPDRLHVIEHGNEELLVRAARDAPAGAPSLRTRLGIDERLPIALFFGNLDPSKGVGDLLEAFAIASARMPFELVIAGRPTKVMDPGALPRRVEELGIGDRVHFDLRYIPLAEVGAVIDAADVVVLPYLTATQSGVLQAAYAFGRPVIATRVGGLPDAVEDGGTGLLVAPGAPAELATALERILGDDDLRRAMGERARELARTRFSWSAVAGTMLQVLDGRTPGSDEPSAARGAVGERTAGP